MSQFIIVHRAPAGKLSLRIVFNPLSGHTHIKKTKQKGIHFHFDIWCRIAVLYVHDRELILYQVSLSSENL